MITSRMGIRTPPRVLIHIICVIMYGTAASHLFLSINYDDCVLSALLLINVCTIDSTLHFHLNNLLIILDHSERYIGCLEGAFQ